jgi:hypothetical protein
MHTKVAALISETEHDIGQLLKQLELSTNQVVEELRLCDMDVTESYGHEKKLLRHVIIKTCRLPGSNWD